MTKFLIWALIKLEKLEVDEIINLISAMDDKDKENLKQLFVMVAAKLMDEGDKNVSVK